MLNTGMSLSGRYRLVQMLGEGGMGAVYKARDDTLQRDVAVKTMHPHFARMDEFRTRFLVEARTAARMNHSSIVQVYDFGQQDQTLYIVMEFIPGPNLAQMLTELRGKKSWVKLDEAITIIHQVALALAYAHNQGILHRDIKPANIMLKPDSAEALKFRPVITDLGLARLLESAHLTQAGTAIGTPAYMSPEQALGETMDGRSDVYSLGVLFYELCVGQVPYPAKTISEAIHYHIKTPLPRPCGVRPDLPATIEQILLKAMAKNPAERYASCEEFAQALDDINKNATAISPAPASGAPGAGGANLATVYQTSIEQVRGNSVLGEMPEPATTPLAQDSIQVWYADGRSQLVPVKKAELLIGRSPENDIALEDTQISRRHARILRDGGVYRVIDLNSSNGTYIGGIRLLPGVAETWLPDKALQVGKIFLRLVQTGAQSMAPQPVPMTYASAVPVVSTSVGANQMAGRVAIDVEETRLSVQPGAVARLSVRVFNQSPIVDKIGISLDGLPNNWIEAIPALQLMPGEQRTITLCIQPPMTTEALAGERTARVRAVSQAVPDLLVEVPVTITVGAFSRWQGQLRPQRLRDRKTGLVEIDNQGNQPVSYLFEFSDRADELQFRPPNGSLQVAPGSRATFSYQATRRSRKLIGGETIAPYSVRVTPGDAQPQTLSGELASRALLPPWVITLLMLLCLALVSAGGWYYQQMQQQFLHQTQTALAMKTDVATQVVPGGLAADQKAQTQTAWPGMDDDGDTLENGQEKSLGTNPDRPDSDQDGLSDGVEVNRLNTNPLVADTDGDGIVDSKDSKPLEGKIDPITPTITPTVTPSPTFTISPTPMPQPFALENKQWNEDFKPTYFLEIQYPNFTGEPQAAASDLSGAVYNLVYKEWEMFVQTAKTSPVDSAMGPHWMKIRYSIFRNDGYDVSLYFYIEQNLSGSAHPYPYSKTLNYDVRNQRTMELGDLFAPGANYLQVFSDYCIADLHARGITGGEGGASPLAENYKNWNLSTEGVSITFDPYQVASYAEGFQGCIVPWDNLRGILR